MSTDKTKGLIIFLNGVSSSGKTTIANLLQEMMEEPYLTIGLDKFHKLYKESFPEKFNPPSIPEDISDEERFTILENCEIRTRRMSTFHHFLTAFSIAGNNLIADTVFDAGFVLEQCISVLYDFPVALAGIHCPLRELEKRERKRGDRKLGLAKLQFNRVHENMVYDIEVDSYNYSPIECAEQIKENVQIGQFKAWEQLKERFST